MKLTAKAAVFKSQEVGFEFEEIEFDELRSDEIYVRIQASGICHTDVVGQSLVPLPAVFGHEGVGIVERVGSSVDSIKPGDTVVVSYHSCGHCSSCHGGDLHLCDGHIELAFSGKREDGSNTILTKGDESISGSFFQQSSFATHVIACARNAIVVPEGFDPVILSAIPCGAQTGAGAVINSFNLNASDNLLVSGVGVVGICALMAAKIVGAYPIVAVDVNPKRLEIAKELGADIVINPLEEDVPSEVKKYVPSGIQYVLETSGNEQALNSSIEVLSQGGECGMVIAPNFGEKYPFSPTEIFKRAANLKGIIQGDAVPRLFIPKMLDWYKRGLFPIDKIIKQYDFIDINDAINDSVSGKTLKSVLVME